MKLRWKKGLSIALALVLSVNVPYGVNTVAEAKVSQLTSQEQADEYIAQLVDSMTTKQKICQRLQLSFRNGWTMEDGTASTYLTEVNSEVAELIGDNDIGSVILFANNLTSAEQTLKMTYDFQQAAMNEDYEGNEIPLLIATDQEGGSVTRLTTGTALPGNMAVGATGDTENAKKCGEIIGRELSAEGINVDCAPDADVNTNPANPVIGLRSFGSNPTMVAQMVKAYIEGLQESNVVTCAKHFPGHGDTATDSHSGLPSVLKTKDEIEECELVPFKAAIEAGTDMIMTAHIQYPNVDTTKLPTLVTGESITPPATMSKVLLQDILRDEMGFEGVISTDSMTMDGAVKSFGQLQADINAMVAGADLLCIPITDVESVADSERLTTLIDGLVAAVNSGEITEESLDASVTRILQLKYKRGILNLPYDTTSYDTLVSNANSEVGSVANHALESDIAAKAITVVKNNDNTLPIKPEANEKVMLMSPYNNEIPCLSLGMERLLANGVIDSSVTYDTQRYSSTSTVADYADRIDACKYVIINSECSSQGAMSSTFWQNKFPSDVAAYCKEKGIKCVVVSIGLPYETACYQSDNVDAVAIAYGNKGGSFDPTHEVVPTGTTTYGPNISAAIEVIFGEYGASGTLPVAVPQVSGTENTMSTTEMLYDYGYGITYDSILPQLQSVSLSGQKVYTQGDSLNLSLTATYDNDQSEVVVSGALESASAPTGSAIEVKGYDSQTLGKQTVNVEYTKYGVTKQASIDVIVEKDYSSFVGNMIYYYGQTASSQSTDVQRMLAKLKDENEDAFEMWESIMNEWDYIENDMPENTGVAPEGIPNDWTHAFVVLGYQLNADGSMQDELVGRLEVALASLEKYPNTYVVVTGGATGKNSTNTEGGSMRDWLVSKGIDEDRIIVDTAATTTVENAKNTFTILCNDYTNIKSFSMISSQYHIKRGSILYYADSLLMARKLGVKPLTMIADANAGWLREDKTSEALNMKVSSLMQIAGINAGHGKDNPYNSTNLPLSKPVSIEVTGDTSYSIGDALKLTVAATYDQENFTRVLADGAYQITGYDNSRSGNQTVQVSYTENEVTVTKDFDVEVKNAPVSTNPVVVAPSTDDTNSNDGGSTVNASIKNEVISTTEKDGAFYNADGTKMKDAIVETADGTKYIVDSDGEKYVSTVVEVANGAKYVTNNNGEVVKGAITKVDGEYYYTTKGTGKVVKDKMFKVNGNKYFASEKGTLARGQIVTANKAKYYVTKTTGKVVANKMFKYNGERYVATKSGKLVTSKWVTIDGVKVYCNKNGVVTKEK